MDGRFSSWLVAAATFALFVAPAGTGLPVAWSAPAGVSKSPLTVELPEGVPGPDARVGWEVVTGEINRERDGVVYALFVNPRYDGIYQITQFRIWSRADGKVSQETEKLLWNAQPGVRTPLHLYAREGTTWQRIPPGTPPYDREIIHAINLYNQHRQARGVDAF